MKKSTADALLAAARQTLDEGHGVHACDDYSGRGMYGKTTAAVVYPDQKTLLVLVAHAVLADPENAPGLIQDLDSLRFDDFGRASIAY